MQHQQHTTPLTARQPAASVAESVMDVENVESADCALVTFIY